MGVVGERGCAECVYPASGYDETQHNRTMVRMRCPHPGIAPDRLTCMRRSVLPVSVGALCVFGLAACGGSSEEAGATSVAVPGPSGGTTSPAPASAASSAVPSASSSSTTTRPSERGAPKTTQARSAPAERVTPGPLVSGEGFLRPGSGTVYQFTAGGGRWRCVVTASAAGCTGDLAAPAQGGSKPDGVEVTADGAGRYTAEGAASFTPRGVDGKPVKAKALPAGRSLPNGTFVCAALADGVQCETASAAHGFTVRSGRAWLW